MAIEAWAFARPESTEELISIASAPGGLFCFMKIIKLGRGNKKDGERNADEER